MATSVLNGKLAKLEMHLQEMGRVLVAFSGGVDSALLLYLGHSVLGPNCFGLTGQSESVPKEEMADAIRVAKSIGAQHLIVRSNELAVEAYRANPSNRCYFCKTELYGICRAKAKELDIPFVLDGTNLDDLGDHRPGLKAASEFQVVSPFVEAGLTKQDIRLLSKRFGLETWKKAEFACLGSRFPYGTEITSERLARIEACESALRSVGFSVFRARFHGQVVRLELGEEELAVILNPQVKQVIVDACLHAGFDHVTIDLQGYRRGSLNTVKSTGNPVLLPDPRIRGTV